jgi:putative spermidine/putrescine transport system ATP-binding protein
VVAVGGAKLAVRADRLRLTPLGDAVTDGTGLAATVTDVEYQGSVVQTSLITADGSELVSVTAEQVFDRDPWKPGARVAVSWEPDDAHALA